MCITLKIAFRKVIINTGRWLLSYRSVEESKNIQCVSNKRGHNMWWPVQKKKMWWQLAAKHEDDQLRFPGIYHAWIRKKKTNLEVDGLTESHLYIYTRGTVDASLDIIIHIIIHTNCKSWKISCIVNSRKEGIHGWLSNWKTLSF
jgi:hypothetical protein